MFVQPNPLYNGSPSANTSLYTGVVINSMNITNFTVNGVIQVISPGNLVLMHRDRLWSYSGIETEDHVLVAAFTPEYPSNGSCLPTYVLTPANTCNKTTSPATPIRYPWSYLAQPHQQRPMTPPPQNRLPT